MLGVMTCCRDSTQPLHALAAEWRAGWCWWAGVADPIQGPQQYFAAQSCCVSCSTARPLLAWGMAVCSGGQMHVVSVHHL